LIHRHFSAIRFLHLFDLRPIIFVQVFKLHSYVLLTGTQKEQDVVKLLWSKTTKSNNKCWYLT